MAGFFEDLIGGGVEVAGLLNQIDRIEGIGEDAVSGLQQVGQDAIAGTQFQPFSVATRTGNVQADANGSLTSSLSGLYDTVADDALYGAGTAFGDAGQSIDQRTEGIFGSALATLMPQFRRDNIALGNQLYKTGRTGITSGTFGGSSEQLANAMAQDEAIAKAYFNSRMAADQELTNAGARGAGLLGASLTPQASLMNYLTPATNIANLGQTGQIAGQNLSTQANVSGIQTQVNAEKTAAELYAALFNTAGNTLGNTVGVAADNVDWGGVWDTAKGWLGF